MSKKEVVVYIKAITPLWTGDAWRENCSIRPSSLLGSLRFWFSVYWKVIKNGEVEKLDKNGVIADNIHEFEKPEEDFTFKQIVLNRLLDEKDSEDIDSVMDRALEELKVSVPSRLFGCTGWKSRIDIEIKSFSSKELKKRDVEFNFPYGQVDSSGWLKRVLFQHGCKVNKYEGVELIIKTTEYWWDKYLADFFEFFKDKIILVGGKLSFGFGMVNIKLGGDSDSTNDTSSNYSGIDNVMLVRSIRGINYGGDKREVLGFNFKYYLRKNENNRKYRKKYFGKKGKASSIYVSHLLKNKENSVYLIGLNNPFSERQISEYVFNKYAGFLLELSENRGGQNA